MPDASSPRSVKTAPARITVRVPLTFRHRPGRTTIILPGEMPADTELTTAEARKVKAAASRTRFDRTLMRALIRAHRWKGLLEDGTYATITDIARTEKVSKSYVSRVLRLTLLAPDITAAILDGRQPHTLDLKTALRRFPNEWNAQRERFGFR
ncbi:hypothetical protein [Glycocaulis sp.]